MVPDSNGHARLSVFLYLRPHMLVFLTDIVDDDILVFVTGAANL